MYELTPNSLKRYGLNQSTIEKANQAIKNNVFEYIVESRNCDIIENRIYFTYYFHFKGNLNEEHFYRFVVNEEDRIVSCACEYCWMNTCHHMVIAAEYHFNRIAKLNKEERLREAEELKQLISDYEEELADQKKEELRLVSKYRVEKLIEDLLFHETIPPRQLLKVRPEFMIVDDIVDVRLKIGYDKMYVVKDISKLIADIYNKEMVDFTKTFSTQVSFEAVDEISRKVIEFFDIIVSYSIVRRDIRLYESLTDQLIKLCQGGTISVKKTVNDELEYSGEVFVTLSDHMIDFSLDKDYNLNIKDLNLIIKGEFDDFIIINGELKRLVFPNPAFKVIVDHSISDGQFNFGLITDIFNNEIYPRIHRSVKVDPKLAVTIPEINYKVELYFDLKDNVLSYNLKYSKNGIEITDVDDPHLNYTISLIKNHLDQIGFDENQSMKEISLITNFLRLDLSYLRQYCDVYLSENIAKMQVKKYRNFRANLSYNNNMLEVCFEDSQFSNEELELIIKSLRKKSKYIKLRKDMIIEVSDEDSEKILNTVDSLNLKIDRLNDPQEIPLYQVLKLSENTEKLVDYSTSEQLKDLIDELRDFKQASFSLKPEIEKVLRPYQKEAFLWMKTLIKYGFGGLLADDMGLGKSLEMISVIASDDTQAPILIICPKSLCYNWRNEFLLWSPEIETVNIIGNSKERAKVIETIDPKLKKVYITSYDSLKNDIMEYQKIKFGFTILDEAQSIKNRDSLRAKSVKLLDSTYRFVLTGTPIENSVVDLWSIFDFLMPGYLGNHSTFSNRYEKPIVTGEDKTAIDRLIKIISPFVLRRTKNDVLLDLPEKIEFIRMASMDSVQRKYYEAQLQKTKNLLINATPEDRIAILASLTRLRQICVDPQLFIENYQGNSAKLDLLLEIVEEYVSDGHKIVIFSQFTSIFDKIIELLSKNKYKYYLITGKTDAFDRVEMANQFNLEENDVSVFLVSLKAGGTGLNLVGADVVVHLDPWWNYAVESQATDRTHRIGQKNVVSVIKLIVENTIEQKVIELQQIKKELAESIIASDDQNIESSNFDDIKYLLS